MNENRTSDYTPAERKLRGPQENFFVEQAPESDEDQVSVHVQPCC